jgi:hypothetical protein
MFLLLNFLCMCISIQMPILLHLYLSTSTSLQISTSVKDFSYTPLCTLLLLPLLLALVHPRHPLPPKSPSSSPKLTRIEALSSPSTRTSWRHHNHQGLLLLQNLHKRTTISRNCTSLAIRNRPWKAARHLNQVNLR